jgi:hypothetical protein
MIDSFAKFVQIGLGLIAAVAIPFIVVQVFNTLRTLAAESKARLSAEQLALVEGGLQVFVVSMRQSGLLASLLEHGEKGLHDLAGLAERWLAANKLPGIDLDFLVDLLKHELEKQDVPFGDEPPVEPVEGKRSFGFQSSRPQLSSAFK